MATISSALRLQDQFSGVIDKFVNGMSSMVDAMENMNRTADMPNMENTFVELRQDVSLARHALDQFNDELGETDRQANAVHNLGSSFGGFSKAVVVANQGLELIRKAWEGIDKLGSTSDARIGADARLGNILDGLRTQAQLEAQVMQAANASRGEYAATAELIARIGRQDYFKGNNDSAIAFAETLNKGLVVSGASAMEAKSALIQLSQGLASGLLRGQEFNSIMENGSVIAEMMSTSLGVTKGELREMAEDGKLTTDIVVASIMAQSQTINEQFASMPTTYGQAMNTMSNLTSDWMDALSEPGMAVDLIIRRMQELTAWAATADGTQFFNGMSQAVTAVVSGIADLAAFAADTYLFFSDNWSTIEPILWGLATAVGGLTLAYTIFKGVLLASAVAEGIHQAALMISSGKTLQLTAEQWGLNAALLACPLTWVVLKITLLIGFVIALTSWLVNLWQTNIDFKVSVIAAWNDIIGFFEHLVLGFQQVGYAVADSFSCAKVLLMQVLEDMVNGAIERINKLIQFANSIPGVSIEMVSSVSFAAEDAIAEEAKRAARAAKLADSMESVAAKSAEREQKLAADADRWRAEAEAKKTMEQEPSLDGAPDYTQYEPPPLELAGGSIDKVGKIGSAVDISNQSLEYLNDIAEVQLLESIETTAGLQLSKEDAGLMQASATAGDTNVYNIQYSGGVKIQNDVKKGEDWETIRRQLEEESQNEINTGISGIEEVLYSG